MIDRLGKRQNRKVTQQNPSLAVLLETRL